MAAGLRAAALCAVVCAAVLGASLLAGSPQQGECRGPTVVYTWVNGSDPRLSASLRRWLPPSAAAADGGTSNRFEDNEELRFSLRSLEQNAAWVGRVLLVTNGQVPRWLRVERSCLEVVAHSAFFAQAAHLPTFSSPAIEANLHLLPRLSSPFLYLNDDVMFGRPVYPEDFHTRADGTKVYLAWKVPDCSPGCPSSWIGDGYCDTPCNCSACAWDAGDCNATAAAAAPSAVPAHQQAENARRGAYCAAACPTTWIGDKYCDSACNVAECAFDAADCGVESMRAQLLQLPLLGTADETFAVRGQRALYFNLTSLTGSAKIVDAYHDKPSVVRSATVSQQHKIMSLTLFDNVTQTVQLSVSWEAPAQGSNTTFPSNHTFTMLVDSTPRLPLHPFSMFAHLHGVRKPLSIPAAEEEQSAGKPSGELHPMGNGEVLGSDVYPWEHQGKAERGGKVTWNSRGPLDLFADSLRYVNALYDEEYGREARQVPAHMPFWMDLEVLRRLHARWPEHWERTSSHRFRSPDDMQFAFSYYYFLMNERRNVSWPQLWSELDPDDSGDLNANEMRSAWVHLRTPPFDEREFQEVLGELFLNGTQRTLSAEEFEARDERELKKQLLAVWNAKPRNKYEVKGTEEVAFVMVHNNDTTLQGKLDDIRLKRQKFVCLNDNLDHASPDTPAVKKMLRDFYMSLYPKRSSFELPEGQSNPYSTLSEYEEWKASAQRGEFDWRWLTVVLPSFGLSVSGMCCVWLVFTGRKRAAASSREKSK